MGKKNLSDLIKRGQDHEDEYESWDPPAGLNLKCVVSKVTTAINDDGTPRWGFLLEVLVGENKGKTFWSNERLSEEYDFMNASAVDAFEALGLSASSLMKLVDSDVEAVASKVEGKKVVVVTAYRKNKKNPKRPWANHSFESAKEQAPPPEPDVDDDDDGDDEDWAD